MKANKLTPGKNLLWESSRMMLPEHKEALIKHRQERSKKEKPIIEDQMKRLIWFTIEEAHERGVKVKIDVFDEYEDKHHIGNITKVDQHRKELKLVDDEEEFIWISFDDILLIDIV